MILLPSPPKFQPDSSQNSHSLLQQQFDLLGSNIWLQQQFAGDQANLYKSSDCMRFLTALRIEAGMQIPDSKAEVAVDAHSLVDVRMQLQRLLLERFLYLTIAC